MNFSDRLRANRAVLPVVTAFVLYGFWVFRGSPLAGHDDMYTHMFFASHFLRSWFDPWNPLWYGGFDQSSYPPLAQQTMAIFSAIFGLRRGCQIVQWLLTPWFVLGVYRFSRIWTDSEPAAFAAFSGCLAVTVFESVMVWGQVPSMFAVGFLLNATSDLDLWLCGGPLRRGLLSAAGFLVVAASHHITVFGSALFLLPAVTQSFRHAARVPWETGARFGCFAVLVVIAGLIVATPFLVYVVNHPVEQVTIPHFSRQNAFRNLATLQTLFLTPMGALAAFIPYAVGKLRNRTMRPLVLSWMIAAILGLADTTPLPRLILGPLFNILTLDRFTFWSSILMLPVVGLGIESLQHRSLKTAVLTVMVLFHLFLFRRVVEGALAPLPWTTPAVIKFLNEPPHGSYRYLTLGFRGASLGWIAAHTDAQSIDGNYHVARPTPELRESGLSTIDSAGQRGMKVVDEFLRSPEKYHLRYVFCQNPDYVPELQRLGWTRMPVRGANDVGWENSHVEPLSPSDWKGPDRSPVIRWIWGSCPLLLVIYGVLVATQKKRMSGDESLAG